ncbi:MAG: cohesin domain-containing protein [Anaerolineales bacterium]
MRTRLWAVCAVMIFCVLLSPFAFLSLADGEIMVSVNAPVEVMSDEDIVIRIDVTEVADLDVCQFDVGYDVDVLEAIDVTAGDVGGTAIPIDMWGEVAQGKMRVLGNVPGVPGVDGAGYLAEIHFHVIGSQGDTTAIELSNGLLGDKYAEAIAPVVWKDGAVRVADSASSSSEGTSLLGLAKTPAASPAASEKGAGDKGLPILAYIMILPIVVLSVVIVWIYGRHRIGQRGRQRNEK